MTIKVFLMAALAFGAEVGTMEWTGAFSKRDRPSYSVIKTPRQWKALWKRLGKPAPPADLRSHFGVAVFLGQKPTGGWSVAFGQTPEGVRFEERGPQGMATMALTQPWAVK